MRVMLLSPLSLLLFSLLLILTFLLDPTSSSSTSQPPPTFDYLKLPLLHSSHPFPPNPSKALPSDTHRLNYLYSSLHHHHRRHHHRKNSTSAARLPLTSGVSVGTGQYFVSLSLGTPPQPFLLVADTGSDLIWVTCSACRNCSARLPDSALLTRHSSTFAPYHCYDSVCQLVPHPDHVPCNHTRRHSACRYEYSYADGSLSSGFFSRETTTFNTSSDEVVKFGNLAFGCGFRASGPSVTGPKFRGAQGVLGLGLGPISFPSQLGRKFGNKFSYCLMDYTLTPTPTSYLLIGGGGGSGSKNGVVQSAKMSYTPLINNSLSSTFYYIGIEAAYVGGVKLQINPSVWAIDDSGNGGTIMDSGTTLTFLVKPAYDKVLQEVVRRVKLPKSDQPNPTFDFCVNVSGVSRLSLPRLSFKLAGGSVFSPPPQNYFIDTAEGVKCLALQSVVQPSGFSLIGNLMQQGFMFEFDKDRWRLGFTRRGCGVP